MPANTAEAIGAAVNELLDALEHRNAIDPAEVVSVIFSVTPDLDAAFPAQFARRRPGWEAVPLLDVQQMEVNGAAPLHPCFNPTEHSPDPGGDAPRLSKRRSRVTARSQPRLGRLLLPQLSFPLLQLLLTGSYLRFATA